MKEMKRATPFGGIISRSAGEQEGISGLEP